MKRNKISNRFGLTGGICSGKSTVSARLAENGALIIDADAISRAALNPGTKCFEDTILAFGAKILTENGTVNRKKLAEIIFRDEQSRQKLNDIIHPFVLSEMIRIAEEEKSNNSGQLIIFDVPLLFECGFYKSLSKNVVVAADDEIRITRAMKRNGMTREEALSRMASQMSQEDQINLADYVIWNNGTVEELNRKADSLYKLLTRKTERE